MFESDGLGMQPRVKEPDSPWLVPGMGVPVSTPADVQNTPQASGASPLSAQFPPNIPDTSGAFAQPPGASLQQPAAWQYDFDAATGTARATFAGEVQFTSGGSSTAGVTSWNGRTGSVSLTAADITGAGGATLASPVFTGTPAAPTAPTGTSTTQVATTAFVAQQIAATPMVATFNGRSGAVVLTASDITSAGGAPAASPALTGTPTAPTASVGNNSTQVATTAFVQSQIAAGTVISFNGRTGAVTLALSDVMTVGGAPIASPNFTGAPTGPTAAPGTSTTQLATTAFVTNAVSASTSGVVSFNTRTGPVTLLNSDIAGAGGALLLSPNFTGTPTAPTATAGTSTTQLATTAFVANAVAATAGVVSFNGRTGPVTLTIGDVTSVGGAPAASPTFTGTPAAPTATAGTNTTQIATTAFVTAAVTASTIPVPVPVAQGGTGQTSLGNGFITANAGVVGSLPSPLPVANGGTGNAAPTAGLMLAPGAGGPMSSLTYTTGSITLSDTSGAGLGQIGTAYYTKIGTLVTLNIGVNIPSGASSANAITPTALPWASQMGVFEYFYGSSGGGVQNGFTRLAGPGSTVLGFVSPLGVPFTYAQMAGYAIYGTLSYIATA